MGREGAEGVAEISDVTESFEFLHRIVDELLLREATLGWRLALIQGRKERLLSSRGGRPLSFVFALRKLEDFFCGKDR